MLAAELTLMNFIIGFYRHFDTTCSCAPVFLNYVLYRNGYWL